MTTSRYFSTLIRSRYSSLQCCIRECSQSLGFFNLKIQPASLLDRFISTYRNIFVRHPATSRQSHILTTLGAANIPLGNGKSLYQQYSHDTYEQNCSPCNQSQQQILLKHILSSRILKFFATRKGTNKVKK